MNCNLTKKKLGRLAAITTAVFLAACSTAPIIINELPANNGLTADTKVGIIWVSRCSASLGCKKSSAAATLGEFVPVGASGLLVYGAIMSAHEEIGTALDAVDASYIVESDYLDYSESVFRENGIAASVVRTPFYPGALKSIKEKKTIKIDSIVKSNIERGPNPPVQYLFEKSYNFSAIANELEADYLLVLDLMEFNINRNFGAFGIPTSVPYASSAVRLHLLDVKNSSLLINDYAFNELFVVDGEWKQPQSWENLLSAIRESLRLSIEEVTSRFESAMASR